MSDDPFRTWDGPYVLGALSPDDRLAYESHLRGCADCSDAVGELAGLPGLLARAAAPVAPADEAPGGLPAPDLLPALLMAARRERRRRHRATVLGWVCAAACAAGLVLVWLLPGGTDPVVLRQMSPVADTGIAGQIGITGVTWGARIELKCSYPAGEPGDERYDLVVQDRSGNRETVGSWKVVPGRTATMNASTAVAADDIGVLEVTGADGRAVLSLPR